LRRVRWRPVRTELMALTVMAQATAITALVIIAPLTMLAPTDITVADRAITGTIDAGNQAATEYPKGPAGCAGPFTYVRSSRRL
jgi:hypothetical protein